MKEYCISITETLARQVYIHAAAADEAINTVKQNWKNGTYILTSDDFSGVDFTVAETC